MHKLFLMTANQTLIGNTVVGYSSLEPDKPKLNQPVINSNSQVANFAYSHSLKEYTCTFPNKYASHKIGGTTKQPAVLDVAGISETKTNPEGPHITAALQSLLHELIEFYTVVSIDSFLRELPCM